MSKAPKFPIGVFPEQVRELINTLKVALGYPIEYTSGAMLVAIATAMGNNWSLQVHAGWREKALLYLALVGNAGANKTHPMSFALAPLVDLDLERIASAEEIEPYVAPPRLVASDVTQEGLILLHKKNHRGLVLFVDELKAWVSNFSRYSSGSQEQFWLSNFSRTPIIVDRKSDAKPVTIPEPLISVIGSTQPSVLRSFSTGDKSTNGFVDRMLFIIKEHAGKAKWNDEELDPTFSEEWRAMIKALATDNEIYNCEFSEEARAIATAWQAKNVDIINECHNEKLVGMYSKLEIQFVRFCLILHAISTQAYVDVNRLEISAQIVGKALTLAEYFRAQAELAQEYLYPDVETELTEKQSFFFRSLPNRFSRKEAAAISKSLGVSKSLCYRCLKDFTGVLIDVNEDGDFYKLEADE